MSFAWDITITADTSEATPKEQTLKLTYGIITKIGVYFPAGCHCLVKVRLLRGKLFGLLPTNPDEWVTGNDETVEYITRRRIDDQPYEVNFVGCSPDTQWDHTVTVRIEMQKEEDISPWIVLKEFVSIIKKLIGVD